MWATKNIPSGNNKLNFFDKKIDSVWKSFLEDSGLTYLVCVKATKI